MSISEKLITILHNLDVGDLSEREAKYLMGSTNKVQILRFQELFNDISSKCETNTTIIEAPASLKRLVWVRPQ